MLDVLDKLRVECPWDRKQTNESLRPNTIEETFELCDALIKNDTQNICKELGDVIMHVMFYALIGQEQGQFDIADVCNKEADKLAVLEKADACAALLQDAMDAAAAGRKAEAASLIAILELNADAAQIAGFEAWLRRHPANP